MTVETAAPQFVAAARGWATRRDIADKIPLLLGEAWDFVRKSGLKTTGHNIVIYHPEPGGSFEKEGCAIEAGPGIAKKFSGKGKIVCAKTPGGAVVTTRHTGPYYLIPQAHDAIFKWCGAHKRKPKGICWEVYGHWTEDESKLVTDVYYLLDGKP